MNSCPSFLRRLHIKGSFNMQSCFQNKKIFENNGHKNAFSPRAGLDNRLTSFFLKLYTYCQCGYLLQGFPIK